MAQQTFEVGPGRDQMIAENRYAGYGNYEKFGENPDIDTGGFEDIWDGGGTYVPPTQARIHNVASDNIADAGTLLSSGTATGGSANTLVDTGATFVTDGVVAGDFALNDTDVILGRILSLTETSLTVVRWAFPSNGCTGASMESGKSYRVVTAASTGASTLWISGLDANFLEQEEFVILNGTSNVATVGSYIRQYRGRIFKAGSSGGAVGIITSTAQTDATVTMQVVDGNNQTLMAIYTVPAGKTGYIESWWAALSKKQVATSNVKIRVGELSDVSYVIQSRTLMSNGSSDFHHEWNHPQVLPGGADIWIEADTDTNDVAVAGGFSILLKNEVC